MNDKIEAGPPVAKDGELVPNVVGFRVRVQRADGSRVWHYEQTDDAETAAALVRNRGLGTVVAVEAVSDGD